MLISFKIDKTIYQSANETDDILRKERIKNEFRLEELNTEESSLKAENDELKKMKYSNKQEIQKLQNKLQQQTSLLEQEKGSSTQLVSNMEQRLTDKSEIINLLKRESDVYQTLVRSKNSEINMLKKDNQRYQNIEQENLELKRKLQEYQQYSQEPRPLIDISKSTNNATTSTTTNNTVELDNQTPLSNVDNIVVKTGVETENDNSPSCQNANKKRKVSSNDS